MDKKLSKFIPVFLLLIGVILLAVSLLIPLYMIKNPSDGVGIIGGAGAPTYMFTFRYKYGGLCFYMAILGALSIIASAVTACYSKIKKN